MPILRRLALVLIALAGSFGPAAAQTPPYDYAITIGTTSVQVLGPSPTRRRVIFHNPNVTALVAVCPVGPTRSANTTVVAVINGAGCITILPRGYFDLQGANAQGPPLAMGSAWVGISDTPSVALTILEFE